ncbi:spore germination protein [Bacillus sp. 03113]|uniref:spore germination protein n=1 Tax=Bacillus sp. 03113 TaxID=2578211 RepID=UPI0011429063|nr:spore germination protein [Bacillus sp. 03113]
MPAFVGPVQIVNASGTVQFGDSLFISPKSNSKSAHGSGSGNTGAFIITNNGLSIVNNIDTSLIDQPTIGNN